jgi:predicted secreted protein
MKRSVTVIAAMVLGVSVMGACSSSAVKQPSSPSASTKPSKIPHPSSGQLGTTVAVPLPGADEPVLVRDTKVPAGKTLIVLLGSNPTTGYAWTITAQPDAALLKPTGSKELSPPSPIPGQPGQQEFSFLGVAKGTTTIEFTYARSFGEEPPAQVLTLTVTVT